MRGKKPGQAKLYWHCDGRGHVRLVLHKEGRRNAPALVENSCGGFGGTRDLCLIGPSRRRTTKRTGSGAVLGSSDSPKLDKHGGRPLRDDPGPGLAMGQPWPLASSGLGTLAGWRSLAGALAGQHGG